MKKLLSILLSFSFVAANAAEVTAVGFSNGDGSQPTAISIVLNAINGANKSIYVAAYAFTSKPIANALVAAKKRGVDVKVVADAKENDQNSDSGKYSVISTTANNGIPTVTNGNYRIFHNKYIVIDSQCVELGSFNYTKTAMTQGSNGNAENAIVVCDPKLAQIYTTEFNYWFSQGQPVQATSTSNWGLSALP